MVETCPTVGENDTLRKIRAAHSVRTAFASCKRSMNNPAASCGVSELGEEICLKGVTPECFYRGSSSEPVCGEPSRTTA